MRRKNRLIFFLGGVIIRSSLFHFHRRGFHCNRLEVPRLAGYLVYIVEKLAKYWTCVKFIKRYHVPICLTVTFLLLVDLCLSTMFISLSTGWFGWMRFGWGYSVLIILQAQPLGLEGSFPTIGSFQSLKMAMQKIGSLLMSLLILT